MPDQYIGPILSIAIAMMVYAVGEAAKVIGSHDGPRGGSKVHRQTLDDRA